MPAAVRDETVALHFRNFAGQHSGRDQIILDAVSFARAFSDKFSGRGRNRAGQKKRNTPDWKFHLFDLVVAATGARVVKLKLGSA